MSATSEVPAAFRNAAGNRGPLALVGEGIADIRSRRRLVRYLVQADVHKRGADTLLGNIWWVLDPLLQMLVYVVFVTIIAPTASRPTIRSSSSRRSCPGSGSRRRSPTRPSSIVSQDQLIKQIQFPKIVLPVAATTAGIVSFAFGTDRARAADAVLPRPDHAVPAVHPGHRRRPVRVHARVRAPGRRRQRLLPRPRQRRGPRPAPVVVPVARACTAWPALDQIGIFKEHPHPARRSPTPTRSRSCSRPTGRSSTGRRTTTAERAAEHRSLAGDPARREHRSSSALTTIVFKRLEPNFAKVI